MEKGGETNGEVASFYAPKTVAQILLEVSMVDDFFKKASILEFHVRALELERAKIVSLKRELPRCMHFLEDATGLLKEQIVDLKGREMGPVPVEFMPVKSGSNSHVEFDDKNSAMNHREKKKLAIGSSAHDLWNIPVHYQNHSDDPNHTGEEDSGGEETSEGRDRVMRKSGGNGLKRREGKEIVSCSSAYSDHDQVIEVEPILLGPLRRRQQKKRRRCWSPELHQIFVEALQQLGGAQKATPKQIREVMHVDDLTSSEIKSHLQKYRIHIKNLALSSATMLNGLWLAQNQHRESSSPSVRHPNSVQCSSHDVESPEIALMIDNGSTKEVREDN